MTRMTRMTRTLAVLLLALAPSAFGSADLRARAERCTLVPIVSWTDQSPVPTHPYYQVLQYNSSNPQTICLESPQDPVGCTSPFNFPAVNSIARVEASTNNCANPGGTVADVSNPVLIRPQPCFVHGPSATGIDDDLIKQVAYIGSVLILADTTITVNSAFIQPIYNDVVAAHGYSFTKEEEKALMIELLDSLAAYKAFATSGVPLIEALEKPAMLPPHLDP